MAGSPVVVVGSGQAGCQAAVSLREQGHRGPITVVGDESVLPYERPPLTKAYLTGEPGLAGVLARHERFYVEHDLELVLGDPATSIDRSSARVVLCSGRTLAYGHLVLATGARPRPVPGALTLRTIADADVVHARLRDQARIVVVGGGFIGLEFAAVTRGLGHEVTVVEALPRALARMVSEQVAAHLVAVHAARGVRILAGVPVTEVRVDGVLLGNGELLPADLVLAGVGVLPNVELARAAGLTVDNGVRVDAHLRTDDRAIFAIGDCASFFSTDAGKHIRLESVQNALDQGVHVAAAIGGSTQPYRSLPWFWSDQYAEKLQIAGLVNGSDRTVITGDPADGRFSVYCFRGERLLGVESVNQPVDHLLARRLLAGGGQLTPGAVAVTGFDLRAHSHPLAGGG